MIDYLRCHLVRRGLFASQLQSVTVCWAKWGDFKPQQRECTVWDFHMVAARKQKAGRIKCNYCFQRPALYVLFPAFRVTFLKGPWPSNFTARDWGATMNLEELFQIQIITVHKEKLLWGLRGLVNQVRVHSILGWMTKGSSGSVVTEIAMWY